jgi:hypothetical protein
MFEHILNWKLLAGSHKFPGPDGGTCINEAALVAAGFKYKRISELNDCPRCFSRIISAYTIGLNDRMPDDLRQKLLLPFVTRLAGTADTPEVERSRSELIVLRTVRDIIPLGLRAAKFNKEAELCEAVKDTLAAWEAVAAARVAAARVATIGAAYAAVHYITRVPHAATAATYSARAAAFGAEVGNGAKIFTIAASILDEAIRLGKEAEPIETALVIERMGRAKQLQPAR